MNIAIAPGRYVVAASGGVDSTALLHALHGRDGVKLIVAHFDHGIREDSADDRRHVHELAKSRQLPFVYHNGELGAGASEAEAREARYNFLRNVRKTSGAKAIITAHHQDDVLETAILNILRGTSRRGLSSLRSTSDVFRPLVGIRKDEIIAYAKEQGLTWREDSTNEDTVYLRNYVRKNILPKFNETQRAQLLAHIRRAENRNQKIDDMLITYLHVQPSPTILDRSAFTKLPHGVAREVIATWLREHGIRNYDKKTIERLVRSAKTLASGKQADVNSTHILHVGSKKLALVVRDR